LIRTQCPRTGADGDDAPRLVDEAVPVVAAVVDDVVVIADDGVGQPAAAHELPDVFHLAVLRGADGAQAR
jgi:hypothetical protein